MEWNTEREELLRKLWAEGFSASQIAKQLGGITRSGVCGKVYRLKLAKRGRGNGTSKASKGGRPKGSVNKGNAAKTKSSSKSGSRSAFSATAVHTQFESEPYTPRVIRPVENVVVPISRGLQLDDLTERTCKWPNGDPLEENFNFCGNEAAEAGPYCKYHARIAFQPAAERRRNR